MTTLNRSRAETLLARMRGKNILIVGDLMLDRYVSGTVSRISPEAPVPVIRVTRERALPGGAANVARNVRALGGSARLVGAVGTDPEGATLLRLLQEEDVAVRDLVTGSNLRTTVKTRIIAERQQVARVDREGPPDLPAGLARRLIRRVTRAVAGADGVIIEDYQKGVVTQPVVDAVIEQARRRGVAVGLDPKNDRLRFERLTLATPNYKEALAVARLSAPPTAVPPAKDAVLAEAARRLSRLWHTDLLIVTLGADGMYLRDRRGKITLLPTHAREVFDVTGAGDTVIATALLAWVAGAEPEEAAALANVAAGVVVGKLGAATCSPEELLAALPEPAPPPRRAPSS